MEEEEAASLAAAASWQPRPFNDLKSIYNRTATEAPAELFRKDLISAMKLPDSEPLATDEYWVIVDQWKQEWERGVQVPVNPDSLPEPSVVVIQSSSAIKSHQEFKMPKTKYIRITKDENFHIDKHVLSTAPAKAEAACSYDLDETDVAWLKLLNGERAACGLSPISEEKLERVIERLEINCWDKIQSILRNEEGLGIEYDENVICDVCRSPDSEEGNEMVFCDSCNICVHQACYGITRIPEGQWLCGTCSLSQRPECVLCPNKGGAMKATRSGKKWAHVSCALWIPEVSIGCVEKMEPITKISGIPQSRWALICVLCRERVGACIQCSVKTCKTAYHVTCAFKHGLEMRAIIEDENADDGVKLRSYCEKHSKTSKKEKSVCSGSEDDDSKRKKRKDMTSEEKNQARAARLHEIEAEFDKHVNIKDINIRLDVDNQALQYIYNYWKLKRRAGNNKPLLPPKSEDVDMLSHKQEQADLEKMKTFVQLRQDLERVRNLCYMVSRREKLSRTFFRMREQTFHKQAAVLESSHLLSASVKHAVIEANHGPSIYDRLYSHGDAEEHKDFDFILARIAGIKTKEDKKPEINGLFKSVKENPYKRTYFNGSSKRRSASLYGSSTSDRGDGTSCSSSSSSDEKPPLFNDFKTCKAPSVHSSNSCSSAEDEKHTTSLKRKGGHSRLGKKRRKHLFIKTIKHGESSSEEDVKVVRKSRLQQVRSDLGMSGSDSDVFNQTRSESQRSKVISSIYSESDSSNASNSQNSRFRTKAAVKEFINKPSTSKSPSKISPTSKKKSKPVYVPSDLIVPQREAAKKASENMKSSTTRVVKEAVEQPVIQPQSPEVKLKPLKTKQKDVKSTPKKEKEKTVDVFDIENEKEDEILSYVPQRQAAKKATESIKSGLGKPVPQTSDNTGDKEKHLDTITKPAKIQEHKRKSSTNTTNSTSSSAGSSSSNSSDSTSSESEEEVQKPQSESLHLQAKRTTTVKDWPFLDKVAKSETSGGTEPARTKKCAPPARTESFGNDSRRRPSRSGNADFDVGTRNIFNSQSLEERGSGKSWKGKSDEVAESSKKEVTKSDNVFTSIRKEDKRLNEVEYLEHELLERKTNRDNVVSKNKTNLDRLLANKVKTSDKVHDKKTHNLHSILDKGLSQKYSKVDNSRKYSKSDDSSDSSGSSDSNSKSDSSTPNNELKQKSEVLNKPTRTFGSFPKSPEEIVKIPPSTEVSNPRLSNKYTFEKLSRNENYIRTAASERGNSFGKFNQDIIASKYSFTDDIAAKKYTLDANKASEVRRQPYSERTPNKPYTKHDILEKRHKVQNARDLKNINHPDKAAHLKNVEKHDRLVEKRGNPVKVVEKYRHNKLSRTGRRTSTNDRYANEVEIHEKTLTKQDEVVKYSDVLGRQSKASEKQNDLVEMHHKVNERFEKPGKVEKYSNLVEARPKASEKFVKHGKDIDRYSNRESAHGDVIEKYGEIVEKLNRPQSPDVPPSISHKGIDQVSSKRVLPECRNNQQVEKVKHTEKTPNDFTNSQKQHAEADKQPKLPEVHDPPFEIDQSPDLNRTFEISTINQPTDSQHLQSPKLAQECSLTQNHDIHSGPHPDPFVETPIDNQGFSPDHHINNPNMQLTDRLLLNNTQDLQFSHTYSDLQQDEYEKPHSLLDSQKQLVYDNYHTKMDTTISLFDKHSKINEMPTVVPDTRPQHCLNEHVQFYSQMPHEIIEKQQHKQQDVPEKQHEIYENIANLSEKHVNVFERYPEQQQHIPETYPEVLEKLSETKQVYESVKPAKPIEINDVVESFEKHGRFPDYMFAFSQQNLQFPENAMTLSELTDFANSCSKARMYAPETYDKRELFQPQDDFAKKLENQVVPKSLDIAEPECKNNAVKSPEPILVPEDVAKTLSPPHIQKDNELLDFDMLEDGFSIKAPLTFSLGNVALFKEDSKEDSARETLNLVEKLRMELSKKSGSQDIDESVNVAPVKTNEAQEEHTADPIEIHKDEAPKDNIVTNVLQDSLDPSTVLQADERWVPPGNDYNFKQFPLTETGDTSMHQQTPYLEQSSPSPYADIHPQAKWSDSQVMPTRRSSSSSAASTASSCSQTNEERSDIMVMNHPNLEMQFSGNVLQQFQSETYPAGQFSDAQFINPVSLFPPPVSTFNTQIPFPSPGIGMFPPIYHTSTPLSKPVESTICTAAFTSSEHNMALTAAMVNLPTPTPTEIEMSPKPVPDKIITPPPPPPPPTKPTRSSARFQNKSPDKSPKVVETAKSSSGSGRGRGTDKRGGGRSMPRGRGRGRGRGRAPVQTQHQEHDSSTINKLVGTVYDFDFDDDNENMADLKSMRERRKSADIHTQSPKVSHTISPKLPTPPVKNLSPPPPPPIVEPVLPGPVDMRTYNNCDESQSFSDNNLLSALSGTTEAAVHEDIDEDFEKAFGKVGPDIANNIKASLSDSGNQLKVKIKGPIANYTATAPPPTPNTNANSVINNVPVGLNSGTSNLRRMRKKELLRQYWTQENMDDSATIPETAVAPAVPPINRTIITIPKAVASMTSIPTREDYRDYRTGSDDIIENKTRKESKARPGALSRELKQLDLLPEGIESIPADRRRTIIRNKGIKMAPKLKIKIGGNHSVVTDATMDRIRPPKKRLSNIAQPSVEVLKRESMKFRKMVMANFNEMRKKKKDKSSKHRKRKNREVQIVSNEDANSTKLIIRFNRKADSESENKKSNDDEVDKKANTSVEVLKDSESNVPSIKFKLARSQAGSGYVMKIEEAPRLPEPPVPLPLNKDCEVR